MTLGTSAVAILISICSLIVSFYVAVRKTDELQMMLPRGLLFPALDRARNIEIWPDEEVPLVFINNGNRPAIVLDIFMYLHQYTSSPDANCGDGYVATESLHTDFKPLVIRAFEIVRSNIKIVEHAKPGLPFAAQDMKSRVDGVFKIALHESLPGEGQGRVQLCLVVTAGTPSEISNIKTFLVSDFKINSDGTEDPETGNLSPEDFVYPKELIKRVFTFDFP